MKRIVPVAVVLVCALTSCTTPVSKLKPSQEPTVSVVEETTQEQSSGLDPSWFPPMANFGHTILADNGLLNIENDQGGEFMAVNGDHSVASSVNTFRFSDEGEALPETLIYRVQFGTKNLLRYACQGIGTVQLQVQVDQKVIAEDTLQCAIPVDELSIEFAVPAGPEVTIIKQPSPDTRGIYEIAFYD